MYDADDYIDQECDPYSYLLTGGYDYDDRTAYDLNRQYSQTYNKIPEPVCKFLIHLHKAVTEGNAYETQNLYENSFVTLTERHFKNVTWPEAEDVAMLVNDDRIFIILYKELYYRHIYARVQGGPTIEQRFDSYFNYCDLFNSILSAEGPIPLELPNRWLWEIIDDFIYQFQAFGHYRSMALSRKNTDDIEVLKSNVKIWNVHSVLNVLCSLVDKSNINRQLEVYTSGGDPDSVAGEFGRHLLYKMLGYFSLVALLRLHSLLGDYHQAIKVLENIDLNKNSMYSRVAACQITTYYYVGFAYMMMRRYADAIRTFSNILLYIQRTRQMFQQRTYQVDQINKQTEQMYTLLAMCLVLHPQQIDESIMSYLQEKQWETMFQLQRGNLQEFENCFSFACPKFLSPAPPNFSEDQPTNYHKEPYFLQLKVFMDEVQQQIMLPNIRSYMKLYTTMPISKLAAFLDMDNEDEFCTHLLCFKHKMKNMVWTKGTSGLEGEFQCGSEVDFFIDKDMVHIADTKVARRYGDFFIRQTLKFEELYHKITALQV